MSSCSVVIVQVVFLLMYVGTVLYIYIHTVIIRTARTFNDETYTQRPETCRKGKCNKNSVKHLFNMFIIYIYIYQVHDIHNNNNNDNLLLL